MKHLHKSSGRTFECGELLELKSDVKADGVRRTYDIIVITYWPDDTDEVILVGFYFGDYAEDTTDYYIDRWLETQS
jgi:hypothetical protein